MVTKNEAIALFTTYNQGFSQRVDAMLRAAASNGQTSLVIPYGNVTNAIAAAVAAELQSAGWTIVNDSTAKTVTVS